MDATFDSNGNRRYYQPDFVESASLFVTLACISLMSILFGRKTAATDLSTLNYARGLVVALYLVSWLFTLTAAMLAQTNNMNAVSCEMSIFVCIVLYSSSKILIYLFLIERVYVVTAIGTARWNSKMFKLNLALLLPYGIIFALAIKFRVAKIILDDPEIYGQCQIGLLHPASAPFIGYDIFLSCWLTGIFLKALTSSTSKLQGPTKSKLRDVARRTLVGSILALIYSTGNIAILVVFNGNERGVLCLVSCTLDVTLNASTIHWVTSRGNNNTNSNSNNEQQIDSSRYDRSLRAKSQHLHLQPLDSHVSVSVESYVEEYHQLHVASKASPSAYDFSD
ncbi:hypothetical protein BGZ49_008226 [Haplosporangium sp. Z 27]|nr:hypothetical protein BGZ49_008226 [Haplosporangium sp. Z 27]